MQARIIVGLMLAIVLVVPATAAANPSITVPETEIDAIANGAESTNATVRAEAEAFGAAAAGEAGDAVANASVGNVPADQAVNVQDGTEAFATNVIGAGNGFAVLAVDQANKTVLAKATEAAAIFTAGVGVANNGILAAGAVGAAAAEAVCQAPINPASPPPVCVAGSIVDAVENAATATTTASANFVTSVPGTLGSTECAIQTAASGLVVLPEDPDFCPTP